MAISKDDVFKVADAIDAAGQSPTLAAVRKALGGGSFTTISQPLNEWKARKLAKEIVHRDPPPAAINDQLNEMGLEIWSQAIGLANARLEAERDDKAEPVFSGELAELAKTRPDVAEQIEGQRKLFFARRETTARQSEQLNKRSAQIASQIDGINAQTAALQAQLVLIQQELTDQQSLLDKGLAQSSRVLALQREEASLQGRSGELLAARAQAEGRATEIELEILRLAAVRREEANAQLRDLGPQALELAERRRALIERISRLEIRAPVSGIVLGLQVTTPRSVLRAAEPVLYIIPQDRPLVITAQVQPIHIDEVHVGQKVRVVFPAFSARTTPELFGHVATVSADALVDQRTQIPFFRAEILLDDGELAKLKDQTLLPGMPVEAFIETGARSPMSYLLKPFTDYFKLAFREG